MCMGFAGMYVYMHAACMPVAHGGQKRHWVPETGVTDAWGHCGGAGNWIQSSA